MGPTTFIMFELPARASGAKWPLDAKWSQLKCFISRALPVQPVVGRLVGGSVAPLGAPNAAWERELELDKVTPKR